MKRMAGLILLIVLTALIAVSCSLLQKYRERGVFHKRAV